MKQAFARRLWVSSLVVAGVGSAASACTITDPVLPVDPNPVVVTTNAPPPISGGTLHVTANNLAIAADSDRDVVWLVDLTTQKLVSTVALQPGDEPGRVIDDGAGRAYVALRRGGAVVTIDLASGKIEGRTAVCSAPRGLAYDASSGVAVVHVACAGGELVTLPAAGGAPLRSVRFSDRDLRDVIVVPGGQLVITRFRSAEILTVDSATGTLQSRQFPPVANDGSLGASFSPTAAWRAVPQPGVPGSVLVVHQIAADSTVVVSQPGGYGSSGGGGLGCDPTIVHATVTRVNASAPSTPSPIINGAAVPVDLAADPDGNYALVAAGSDQVFFSQGAQVPNTGEGPVPGPGFSPPCTTNVAVSLAKLGQPVALDFSTARGAFAIQLREPSAIVLASTAGVSHIIGLPGATRADTGHYLFHHNASATSAVACASCHPEGHDDAHLWTFDTSGQRRTQTVSGGVLATAPLHWDGSMTALPDIMNEVFVNRMGGAPQGPQHVAAFGQWLDTIPAYPASPTGTQASIDHGKDLFHSDAVGCAGCHSGAHFTNNQTVDVGTASGEPTHAFQVPTLIGVAARAPYMHNGCAATLVDRFSNDPAMASCNGGQSHGHTSQLSASDVGDLIAYLETL